MKFQTFKRDNSKLMPGQEELLKSYFNNEVTVREFPKYLVIEPTNCCNLNCIMCPRREMTRPQGYMEYGLFKKIITECEGRVDFIYLHFFGEPTLHPEIIDFINFAAGKGITIALSTNATVLTEKTSRDLIQSKLDLLIISIDSLHPEIYKKIRKGGKLEDVLKNIDTLLDLLQANPSTLNVSLQMIEMSLNKDEISTFKSYWNVRDGLNLTVKPLYNYAGQVQNFQDLGSPPKENSELNVCVEPWRGLVIGWDGVVVPCCNDFNYKVPLGSVKTNSLEEIWNSEKIRELRQCQIKGMQKTNELCAGCFIHYERYLTAFSHISSFNPARKEIIAYFDKGLWAPEIYPEYENLWTKKFFEISVQDKFEDITITLCNENPDMEFVEVQILLFGRTIKVERIGRKTDIHLQTPELYKGRLLRYGFILETDWEPDGAGKNPDHHRIGVKIERIRN